MSEIAQKWARIHRDNFSATGGDATLEDIIQSAIDEACEAKDAEIERLRKELNNFVKAKRFDRSCFETDTDFVNWVVSRSNAALQGGSIDRKDLDDLIYCL